MKYQCSECQVLFSLGANSENIECPACGALLNIDHRLIEGELLTEEFKKHRLFPVFVILLFATVFSLMTSEFFFFDEELAFFGGIKYFWLIMIGLGGALLLCTGYISHQVNGSEHRVLETRRKGGN